MYTKLPNLELLEYIAKEKLVNDLNIKDTKKLAVGLMNIRCEVFMQTWGNTATAFGGMGGDAMTDAYTVVFHELNLDIYVVFIDNRYAYTVKNATEEFKKDLFKHSLKSISEAKQLY